MELEWDFDSVEVGFVGSLKRGRLAFLKFDNLMYLEVDHVSLGLGSADVDVKGVDDGLPEVLAHGAVPQRGEVDAVEVLLVPEVHLGHNSSKPT